jgi:hypothetical protein
MRGAASSEFIRVDNRSLLPDHAQTRPSNAQLPQWHEVKRGKKHFQTVILLTNVNNTFAITNMTVVAAMVTEK